MDNLRCAFCGKDSGIAWGIESVNLGDRPCQACGTMLHPYIDEDSDCNYWFATETVEVTPDRESAV